jgi:endonuclease YncB( thermonuclease family)
MYQYIPRQTKISKMLNNRFRLFFDFSRALSKSYRQSGHSFAVSEIPVRLHSGQYVRAINSVLSWLKRLGGWNVWRGVRVLATHLSFLNFITDHIPFGVCRTHKARKNRENSIFYKRCVVFLSCLFFASSVLSDVPARVLYVIDGDTFKAKINLDGQFHQTSVRVAHIDSPETKIGVQCPAERLAGKKATSFAKGILKREMQVTLQDIKPGFYPGRIIAAVKLPDQRDFGQLMLNAGYAVPYEGGKKRKVWCK